MADFITWLGAGTGLLNAGGASAGAIKTLRAQQTAIDAQLVKIATQTAPAQMYLQQGAIAALNAAKDISRLRAEAVAESARQMFIEVVNAGEALRAKDAESMVEMLIEKMATDDYYISPATVGHSVAYAGWNTGAFVLLSGVTNPDSVDWQQIRAEDVNVTCIRDAQGPPHGIRAGEEIFELAGRDPVCYYDQDFPAGSGMKAEIRMTHGGEEQKTGPGQNMLLNGGLKEWNAANEVPDGWVRAVGSSSTLARSDTSACRGTYHGRIIGDVGETLTEITQLLNGAVGRQLKPRTIYAVNLWLQDGVAPPTAGVLRLALKDSGGTILNGTAAKQDITLSALSATYQASGALHPTTCMLATPAQIPSGCKFSVGLSTAIGNGEDFYFDEITLQEAYHIHPAGPYFALAAGATDPVTRAKPSKGDRAIATFTNDWADSDTWMLYTDILFHLYEKGLLLRTAGTTLINDNLIDA